MGSPAGALREAVRVVRDEVAARRGRFFVLAGLTFAAYVFAIAGVVTLRAGAVPDYVRGFSVLEGLQEVLTLSMPLSERYELLAEQPLLEVGYLHPVMGTLEGASTLTLHVLFNLLLMSFLMAAYMLVVGRALRTRGLAGRALGGLGLAGGGSTVGLLTAAAATVACCGGPATSALLTLLGASAGVSGFVTQHDRAFGAAGVLVMLVSLGMAARLARAACQATR